MGPAHDPYRLGTAIHDVGLAPTVDVQVDKSRRNRAPPGVDTPGAWGSNGTLDNIAYSAVFNDDGTSLDTANRCQDSSVVDDLLHFFQIFLWSKSDDPHYTQFLL
jgi:hypothetical protein